MDVANGVRSVDDLLELRSHRPVGRPGQEQLAVNLSDLGVESGNLGDGQEVGSALGVVDPGAAERYHFVDIEMLEHAVSPWWWLASRAWRLARVEVPQDL